MAEQSEQIVIDVQVNTGAIAKQLGEATNKVRLLKQEQKQLDKALAEGRISEANYGKAIAESKKEMEEAQRVIKSSTAALQVAGETTIDTTASLDEQRQTLNTLQKAYAQLSGEAKAAADADGGLRDQIKALSDALKEQEAAIGDTRRNVGNYSEAIEGAFGNIAKSAGDLAPAVSILRSMGGEGKKLGDALDMVGKVMQLVGKAGNAVTASIKAQTAATNGQTAAQTSLNAVMAANPIGLIVAGISTLLPLIQSFCSSTKDAETAQKAFNEQAERYNQILAQRGREEDFELAEMKIMGASELELAQQRKENRKRDYNDAVAYYNRLDQLRQKAHDEGKKKLEEEYETQLAEQQKVVDQTQLAWQKAGDAVALEQLRITQEAVRKSEELKEEQKEKADARRAAEVEAEKQLGIQVMDARLTLAQMEAQRLVDITREQAEAAKAALDALDESEEEEFIPTPADMVRERFGLDNEAVAYFEELLAQGVSASESAHKAMDEQAKRTMLAHADAASSIAGSMSQLFQGLGTLYEDFGDDNEKAAKKAKLFGLAGVLAGQAQAIANTVAATTKAIEAATNAGAATGIAAPFTTPAFIAEMVAIVAGAAASAISGIVQAKQILSSTPAFETGGIVGGTSYTGDNIVARLNSREMVLPTDYQERLFEFLSSGNEQQTLGFDYEMMAQAVAALPAPKMVYSEFEDFENNVAQFDEIASV